MQEQETEQRHAVALHAAWEAAALCSAAYGGAQPIQRKGYLDLVTETDGAVERAIIDRLRAAFPNDRIVGEESAEDGYAALLALPGYCWLLDPICGTDNFAHDFSALYCTNIALLYGGKVVAAVVAEGARPHELLSAVRGAGAWAVDRENRRRPLRVTDASGIVALDLGYLPSWGRPERPALIAAELIRRNHYALRVLSTSLTLTQQTRGALAGNVIEEAKPWDLAAGALLLAEAGAPVSDLLGRPWRIDGLGLVSGSTPAIHADLLDSVAHAFRQEATSRAEQETAAHA